MQRPETRYARNGDVHIAYQVSGSGPIDLVFVPGFMSHLDYQWEDPGCARLFRRLASFARLIRFDKRGTGLSDRAVEAPTLEQRMDDVRAVMDEVGSERAVVMGNSEGGPMSVLFAATYPQRTRGLVLYGSFARIAWCEELPWGRTEADHRAREERYLREWGTGSLVDSFAPADSSDPAARRWWAEFEKLSASPGTALAVTRINYAIDVRHVLPLVHSPALVLHRKDDRVVPVEHGRYLASHLPQARYVELAGDGHAPWSGDVDTLAGEVEEFVTGSRPGPEAERVLATLLFTDIVDATACAARLGDARWRGLLEQQHAVTRRELARFRGREIDCAGDGFLAAFDGPARAVRCAAAINAATAPLGLKLRAGLHTGEVERMGDKLGGIAVHIGARVAAEAAPGEILVSGTVRDLVAGSGLSFAAKGAKALKGVPGEWRLFALAIEDAR
jgi:pimeloyl-ACP methyl ester carboxylesterase